MYSYLQVAVINSVDNNLMVSEIKLDMLSKIRNTDSEPRLRQAAGRWLQVRERGRQ